MRNSLLQAIARNPWASAQDGLLAVSVLAVGLLLAVEFDLLQYGYEMTGHERRITLMEAIALTALLAICISAFVARRLSEEQREFSMRDERDDTMRELRDQATRDELTGLANRRAMLAALKELCAAETAGHHAFFLMDLNGFKRVNDGYGHAAGDSVLTVIAERLRRVARPSDLLARFGGDEFAVLAYDVDQAGAEAVGQRFIAALDSEIQVEGVGHRIGVSVGGVLVPDDCGSVQQILAKADVAMYRAKATKRSALVFYCSLDEQSNAFSA